MRFIAMLCLLAAGFSAQRSFGMGIYTDALVEGWQNWSWATVNTDNATPAHGGNRSMAVTAAAYQALYLAHADFNSAGFTELSFWINGGPTGGQKIAVKGLLSGKEQSTTNLPGLPANAWKHYSIPLAALGVAGKPTLSGFWFQSTVGAAQQPFYVDDVELIPLPPPSLVNVTVNGAAPIRKVDARMFGMNTAVWDNSLNSPDNLPLMREAGIRFFRFPGGSLSDEYHWATGKTSTNAWQWAVNFNTFGRMVTNLAGQAIITANYGTGTPAEAAAWVRHSNITNHFNFRYWEVGNENYGNWEADSNALPHDPFTYANRAAQYIAQMKAADPTIKIGVVAVTGEDAYSNGYTGHAALNPRTGASKLGWTPVMLATLKALGVTPDFLVYHRYEQNAGNETDSGLLQSAATWPDDAANLRQQLTDYLGAAGASVELYCTENNSVSSGPGKQTTSLVNGLFFADSFGQVIKTEFNAFVWWDLRNGPDTKYNNAASLYGWRNYGDYGILNGLTDKYPSFYALKLLSQYARPGDDVLATTTDYSSLAVHAIRKAGGGLNLLVINKSPTTALNAKFNLGNYLVGSNLTAVSFGIPQDEAARTGTGSKELATNSMSISPQQLTNSFPPYSMTLLQFSPAAPRLNFRKLEGSPSESVVSLEGSPAARYVLQASTDLINWTSFSTNLAGGDGSFSRTNSMLSGGGEFTRSHWLP